MLITKCSSSHAKILTNPYEFFPMDIPNELFIRIIKSVFTWTIKKKKVLRKQDSCFGVRVTVTTRSVRVQSACLAFRVELLG